MLRLKHFWFVQLNAYKNRISWEGRESGTRGLAWAAISYFNESGLFVHLRTWFILRVLQIVIAVLASWGIVISSAMKMFGGKKEAAAGEAAAWGISFM